MNFNAYPVQSSLGVLGRKWALLVLMNVAFGRARRFNELLRAAPGMSKRILAMRLRELESDGFLTQTETPSGRPRWLITAKGADVLPVLLTLIHFGSRWHASGVPLWGGSSKPIEVTFSGLRSTTAPVPPVSRFLKSGAATPSNDRAPQEPRDRSGKRLTRRVR